MIFGFAHDGHWTFSKGQSGAGVHIGLWWVQEGLADRLWRVTVETDEPYNLFEFRNDEDHCEHLLVFLKDKVERGQLTLEVIEKNLERVIPPADISGIANFGRFA